MNTNNNGPMKLEIVATFVTGAQGEVIRPMVLAMTSEHPVDEVLRAMIRREPVDMVIRSPYPEEVEHVCKQAEEAGMPSAQLDAMRRDLSRGLIPTAIVEGEDAAAAIRTRPGKLAEEFRARGESPALPGIGSGEVGSMLDILSDRLEGKK